MEIDRQNMKIYCVEVTALPGKAFAGGGSVISNLDLTRLQLDRGKLLLRLDVWICMDGSCKV